MNQIAQDTIENTESIKNTTNGQSTVPSGQCREVYLDSEANALVRPDKIWCIVCIDLNSGEQFTFTPNSPLGGHNDFKDSFIEFAKTVKRFYGHNILGYDSPYINRAFGQVVIDPRLCTDTLVLSRLLRPTTPFQEVPNCYNRQYGHSLEAWGRYLQFPKGEFNDWTKFSQEQLEYCIRDCLLGIKILRALEKEQGGHDWSQSIALEHAVAYMLWLQTDNGFYLDQKKCKRLIDDTGHLLEEMNEKLGRLFKPIPRLVRNYTPKTNKDGSLGKVSERILKAYYTQDGLQAVLKEDGSYDLYEIEAFNPNSGKQVAERLQGLGWQPKSLTEKGNIKTDRETLQEALTELLEAHPELPELRCLADYGIVDNRHEKASKWLELANHPNYADGRVHGSVIGVGASTSRCSHFADNMANIASVELDKEGKPIKGLAGGFGWESRDCWSVPEGKVLVGADASGIQLRALAHYMNDPVYTKHLLEGDIHEVNRKAAGISTRPIAKTFIYGFLLGAGDEKVGSIMGIKEEEWDFLFKWAKAKKRWNSNLLEQTMAGLHKKNRKADKKTVATIIKGFKVKEEFLDKTPALKRFRKQDIPAAAKQGYVIGLDGRKIWVPNEHLAMGAYLQGFEAVVMKQAMWFYHTELNKLKIPFKQVAFTHDEFEVECLNEHADTIGKVIVEAIKKAGIHFKSNCPLDGQYKVGNSWADVH